MNMIALEIGFVKMLKNPNKGYHEKISTFMSFLQSEEIVQAFLVQAHSTRKSISYSHFMLDRSRNRGQRDRREKKACDTEWFRNDISKNCFRSLHANIYTVRDRNIASSLVYGWSRMNPNFPHRQMSS